MEVGVLLTRGCDTYRTDLDPVILGSRELKVSQFLLDPESQEVNKAIDSMGVGKKLWGVRS